MSLAPHSHDHGQGRPHAHGHSHSHAHAHAPSPSQDHPARRADPGVSLLRMSAIQRIAIALALVGAIWLGVVWAWA